MGGSRTCVPEETSDNLNPAAAAAISIRCRFSRCWHSDDVFPGTVSCAVGKREDCVDERRRTRAAALVNVHERNTARVCLCTTVATGPQHGGGRSKWQVCMWPHVASFDDVWQHVWLTLRMCGNMWPPVASGDEVVTNCEHPLCGLLRCGP